MTFLQLPLATALWRRVDGSGHDSCRVDRVPNGWHLHGTAVFRHERGDACLRYAVHGDDPWRSQRGRVEGWVGSQTIDIVIERTREGKWSMNGAPVPRLFGCIDLDYSFTPATNLIPVKRLTLGIGSSADAVAAWFNIEDQSLTRLSQRYERRSALQYAYTAAEANFSAIIDVTPNGLPLRYPPVWELVQA